VPARFVRLAFLAALAALCLVPAGATALDAGSSLRISFLPQKTFRGQTAKLTVVARPSGVRCSGRVVYADGRRQGLRKTLVRKGKATWTWRVPLNVKLGDANVNVACGRAGRAARTITVAGAPTEPARVEVEKQGFSQRVKSGRREVSYGIVLANVSPENDALSVSVHVNFLDATNTVLKTDVNKVGVVGAKAQHFLGGSVTIPEGIPVSTLETVVRVGAQEPKALKVPELTDYRILASRYDPGWVAAVMFQALNDEPLLLFTSPKISVVVFDRDGNVIGGGTGYSSAPLAPGVRAQYDATGGVSAIPFDRAASAGVSVLGSYERVT
jgi:hypothetical protein